MSSVHWIVLLLFAVVFSEVFRSKEEEIFNIPKCDELNPKVQMISSDEDWNEINNPEKSIFCVSPGNYETAGTIKITAKGTKEEKKFLFLNDGNEVHPGKLETEKQAKVELDFQNASYWIVDRLSCTEKYENTCFSVHSGSFGIILSRLFATDFYGAVLVRGSEFPPYTSDITIQNCRFDPMSFHGIDNDKVAISLSSSRWNKNGTLINTKILNNEIRNSNDGIQTILHPEIPLIKVQFPGTLIEGNHIYIDTDVYTDGNGNIDPNGKFALTENAIDIKAASYDITNPLVIRKNIFWGWRRTDKNGGGSGSWGSALGTHFEPHNVIIEKNLIFDSNRAISWQSGINGTIKHNVLYDIGYNTDGNTGYSMFTYTSKNVNVEKNIIYPKDKKGRWFSTYNDETNLKVFSNVAIDAATCQGTRTDTTTFNNNYHYNTTRQKYHDEDGKYYPDVGSANHEDFTFTTDIFTNNPRTITLKGIKPTINSPHVIENSDFLENFKDDEEENKTFGALEIGLIIGLVFVFAFVFVICFALVIVGIFILSKKKINDKNNDTPLDSF